MDVLDILEEILLRSDDSGIIGLKLVSKELSKTVEEIEKDQEYWRKRLNNYLGFEVFERVEDIEDSEEIEDAAEGWKTMYTLVVDAEADFYEMISLNYVEIVAGLIKLGFDPSADGNNSISLACTYGHLDLVNY